MRLTIVCPSAWPALVPGAAPFAGGAEFQLLLLAHALRDRGHEVAFVVGDFGQPEQTEVDGMQVHRAFRLFEGHRKLRFVPDMWKLRGAIRRSRPEVVNQRSTAFYTGQTCAFAHEIGASFVFSLGIDYNCHRDLQGRASWPIPSLYGWGIRSAELVLAQTQEQANLMRSNFGRDDVRVLPNLIQLPDRRDHPAREGPLLWVGSLARRKRPEVFVEAARLLPKFRFRMVGGPGEDAGYDEEIRQLASQVPNVEFAGFVPPDRIDEEFRRARVYVNTSWLEGLPNTFLQAWSHGVPTVTVSVDPDGVIAEKGLGGVSGSPQALPATLDSLLSDPPRLEEAGRRARAHVDFHDVRSLGPLAERFFLDAVAMRGSSASD